MSPSRAPGGVQASRHGVTFKPRSAFQGEPVCGLFGFNYAISKKKHHGLTESTLQQRCNSFE
jgi:hypothetical protein